MDILRRLLIVVFAVALAWMAPAPAHAASSLKIIGVEVRDVSLGEARKAGRDPGLARGAKITGVTEASPAARAGVATGDIIVSVDDHAIASAKFLKDFIASMPAASQVRLTVVRGQAERIVTVDLASKPKPTPGVAEAEPVQRLIPVLETGGHRAVIRALIFTPKGDQLISAGNDKLIRIWDVKTGATVRTIRGENQSGREGQILALALSPDGQLLAAGGWMTQPGEATSFVIRLYDFNTGAVVALLPGHTGRVGALAFSKDGRQLISGSEDKTAIIWDVAARKPLQVLKGHRAEVYAVAFSSDPSKVITGSFDSKIKQWRVSDGTETMTLEGHQGMVNTLAVQPRGGMIASGSRVGEIFLWDEATGRLVTRLEQQKNVIGSVAFSRDGRRLLTTAAEGGDTFPQRVWDVDSGAPLVSYLAHDDGVGIGTISPDETMAATAGGSQNEIHIWNLASGKIAQTDAGAALVLRGAGLPVFSVGFSPDGRYLLWGSGSTYRTHNDRGDLAFQLRLPSPKTALHAPEPINPAFAAKAVRAQTSRAGLSLAHAHGGDYGQDDGVLEIRKADKIVQSITRSNADGYGHFAYTLTLDGQQIISGGSNGYLHTYGLDGKLVGRFIGHESVVWAAAVSPDGRYLASSGADQTTRLWNLKTRELIVTLFHGRDGQWVLWTPQGYYDCSGGADKLIGWQINRGQDKAADFVTAAQLRDKFNRPDIVSKAIILASATAAIAQSNGTNFDLAELLARPVPSLKVLTPADRASMTTAVATVRVAFSTPPDPIKSYTVMVNSTLLVKSAFDAKTAATRELTLEVPLAKGTNRIVITATNEVGLSAPAEGTVTIINEGEGALDHRGRLYVLAVGVDRYPKLSICGPHKDQPCDLAYSGRDAVTFSETVIAALGPEHEANPNVQILANLDGHTQPTAANISRALSTIKNRARPNDTVVVFIAGHGTLDDADYTFLSTDAERDGNGWDGPTVVKWSALESSVFSTKGRRLLFVDTCHAAGAYNNKLGNSAFHNDVVAFTASGQDQQALEIKALEHGVFTFALVEGLGGAAGSDEARIITVDRLGAYIKTKAHALIEEYYPNYDGVWPVPEVHKASDAGNHVLVAMKR